MYALYAYQLQGLAIADAVTAIGSVCTSIDAPSAIDSPQEATTVDALSKGRSYS